ncbi:MAG: DJ-1/PfpI family protein [Candidatus Marinimicrobia bacterium]|nr:DJ-1/PfpI family protein [Candidatus Neomarinimicrobiota bacterium]
MSKRVLVPLAEGFEEIEAVTIIDVLRRAGAEVTTVGLGKRNVTGSHGISIIADSVIEDEVNKGWDMIALPGGVPGAPNLSENAFVLKAIQQTVEKGNIIAAVCAAPIVLEKAGVISGKNVTSHPSSAQKIISADYQGTRVAVDGNIITGQACGSAMEFAFELVAALFGSKKVEEINKSILFNRGLCKT